MGEAKRRDILEERIVLAMSKKMEEEIKERLLSKETKRNYKASKGTMFAESLLMSSPILISSETVKKKPVKYNVK